MLMTIKRRLFISNIFMIVIPVVISIIISITGMAIAWNIYFQESRYNIENQREFYEIRDRIMSMSKILLEGTSITEQEESIVKIEEALKQNNITLSIFVSGEEVYSIGGTNVQSKNKMLDAVWAIEGEGTVTIGNEEVFAQNVIANDKTYLVYPVQRGKIEQRKHLMKLGLATI
jgi:hypothetical protein